VIVQQFRGVKEAFDALRDQEYREFLREIGCPANEIDAEVRALLEREQPDVS
jgi:hypothetical protein